MRVDYTSLCEVISRSLSRLWSDLSTPFWTACYISGVPSFQRIHVSASYRATRRKLFWAWPIYVLDPFARKCPHVEKHKRRNAKVNFLKMPQLTLCPRSFQRCPQRCSDNSSWRNAQDKLLINMLKHYTSGSICRKHYMQTSGTDGIFLNMQRCSAEMCWIAVHRCACLCGIKLGPLRSQWFQCQNTLRWAAWRAWPSATKSVQPACGRVQVVSCCG